jgi:hypothetical protein
LEAGKLIDQSPSAIKLRLYQTQILLQKTLPYFPFPEVCLEKENKNKNKEKEEKDNTGTIIHRF